MEPPHTSAFLRRVTNITIVFRGALHLVAGVLLLLLLLVLVVVVVVVVVGVVLVAVEAVAVVSV
jgi:hypothetical protein